MDPRLFRAVERVCSLAIQLSGNTTSMRETVAAFSLELQMQGMSRHGFRTADAEAIHNLLARTDPNRRTELPRIEKDIFEYLSKSLDVTQLSAAGAMRNVWDSFGRFLTVATRGFEPGGGSKRTSVQQPLDVMADDTWECYKEFFKPWISAASRRTTGRIKTGNMVNCEIVHRIIVEEQFPSDVDRLCCLPPGAALKTFRYELNQFYTGNEVVLPDLAEAPIRVFVYTAPEPLAIAAA